MTTDNPSDPKIFTVDSSATRLCRRRSDRTIRGETSGLRGAMERVRALSNDVTLRQAFDEVVRRNTGGVWIVWQHKVADGAVGCRSAGYYADGVTVGAASRDFKIVR